MVKITTNILQNHYNVFIHKTFKIIKYVHLK